MSDRCFHHGRQARLVGSVRWQLGWFHQEISVFCAGNAVLSAALTHR